MRILNFICPLVLLFLSCKSKHASNEKKLAVQPSLAIVSSEKVIPGNHWPSFAELNEKHFYFAKSIENGNSIRSEFYCLEKGYRFSFDPEVVFNFCDSSIQHSTDWEISQRYYDTLRNLAQKSLQGHHIKFRSFLITSLLPYCLPFIEEIKSGRKPKALILLYYKTMCEDHGRDLQLITSKGDTISLITNTEMCMN
jgi:hypothetical protein